MTEIIIRTNVLDGENQGVTFMNGCTWNDLHTQVTRGSQSLVRMDSV